jgi:hypothetical protein
VAFVVDLDPCQTDAADLGWNNLVPHRRRLQNCKASGGVSGRTEQPLVLLGDVGDGLVANLDNFALATVAAGLIQDVNQIGWQRLDRIDLWPL